MTAKTGVRLRVGTTFTAISNTAATPIAGTFANLPDGSIITTKGNKFPASYEGGDGNDLTLTVVQLTVSGFLLIRELFGTEYCSAIE